jgi:hypothetical protein
MDKDTMEYIDELSNLQKDINYYKKNGISNEHIELEKLLNTIISVKCNGVSKPKDSDIYALMYPAFLEFRHDEKTVADSIEEILNIEKGAISLASR